MNLAHIKCLSMLLGALCTAQTVCLSKLDGAFGNKASRESCFRRIQRFMAQLVLDFDVVAEYLRSRIPLDGPYTLTMDRTNWKLGELNINALVSGIAYDHMSFPILFRLLPKRGNSNHKERWTIETMFKGLKSSGFNIEDTHMVHIDRIEQLFGVVIIAYTWAHLVGIAANIKVKAIRVLNNGRRAISIVKYGLNFIADTLFSPFRPTKINVFEFLSCT